MTVVMTVAKEKSMTTNRAATPKRDKHPARGARVLTTGISIASVLGLTSAYAIAAQQSTLALASDSTVITPDINQPAAPLAATPVIAPTQPAAATPASSAAPVVTATTPTSAPVITKTIKVKAPKRKRSATKSSGSK
jgi:hypothetical protein